MNCKSAAKKSVILIFALALALATILSLLFIETPDVAQAAVLKQGSRGDSVKTVQQKLIRWGYLKGSADGIFGAKTKAAVIAFQKKNGLKSRRISPPTQNDENRIRVKTHRRNKKEKERKRENLKNNAQSPLF